MENPKTPETLEAQAPVDKTLEEASGSAVLSCLSENCDGLPSVLEMSAEENGKVVDINDGSLGADNMELVNRVVEAVTNVAIGCENVVVGVEKLGNAGRTCTNGVGIEKGCLKDGGLDGDNKVRRVSVDSKQDGELVGLVSDGSKDMGVEKIMQEVGMKEECGTGLDGINSARKIEFSGDGISLFVDICGPPARLPQDNLDEEKCCGLMASEKAKEAGNVDKENETDTQDYNFAVGDVVWVKTKSQTWWPGKIYDPLDVPGSASKSDQRDCLFVGYLGSSHLAWSSPSQLKPFHENFEHMSRQNKSRSFVGAVEKAAHEFGRRVKLEMTCSCALKQGQRSASDPHSKEGVAGPDHKSSELGEFSVTQFESAKFLLQLKTLAVSVSMPRMIEFAVAQNRLSAFYRFIGHFQLPMHQLQETSDVENTDEDIPIGKNKLDVQIEDRITRSAEEDSQSTLISVLEKESEVSADKVWRIAKNEDLAQAFGGRVDVVPEDCKSKAAKEVTVLNTRSSKSIKREKDLDVRNSGDEFEGGSEGKIQKGFDSRERKKSRYLSFPYINWGNKGLPAETESPKAPKVPEEVDTSASGGQFTGSAIVKGCNKRFWRKWYKKFISGSNKYCSPELMNTSSVEFLSELHFTAVDCLYPNQSQNFNSIEWFFSRFRISAYHDEALYEIYYKNMAAQDETITAEPDLLGNNPPEIKHPSPAAKSVLKKRKQKELSHHSGSELTASALNVFGSDLPGVQDANGNQRKDSVESNQHAASAKPEGKMVKKKGKANAAGRLKTKSLSGLSDVNINLAAHSSFLTESLGMGRLIRSGKPKKKQTGREGASPTCLQTEQGTGIPDLNGNSAIPTSSVEDHMVISHIASSGKPELKKRKRKGTASAPSEIQSASGFNGSLVIDLGVINPHSLGGKSEREGKEEATPVCSDSKLATGLQSFNGSNAEPGLLVKDRQDINLVSAEAKPRKRGRKRKDNATSQSKLIMGIPDLNGVSAEHSTLGKEFQETNGLLSQTKSERKKRRRKGEATSEHLSSKLTAGRPDININYDRLETNGEAPVTALLLTFAPGFPMPSKEDLVAKFCRFGPVKESETQLLEDSSSAQVVFMTSADAGEALRSFEKNNPSISGLVNCQLHHPSAVSKVLEPNGSLLTALGPPPPMEGSVTPGQPSASIPNPGEAPALDFIKQNLQMMTSMLEKSGDNLSPETRSKLEGEIKGLLRKVSSMAGSSST